MAVIWCKLTGPYKASLSNDGGRFPKILETSILKIMIDDATFNQSMNKVIDFVVFGFVILSSLIDWFNQSMTTKPQNQWLYGQRSNLHAISLIDFINFIYCVYSRC